MKPTPSGSAQIPHDYRFALDAARSILGPEANVICGVQELEAETRQRLNMRGVTQESEDVLWIEPLAGTWRDHVNLLAETIPIGGQLVIVASGPFARILPERRGWDDEAVGLRPRGTRRLIRNLVDAGFSVKKTYGIHTVQSIGINLLSHVAEVVRRPDLSDRLHFAARLRYCNDGRHARFATVEIVTMRRDRR